jgi:Zn-dependent membrane protease YugP
MQKKKGYIPYKIRTALVPVVNFGTYLALPLVLVGLVLDVFVASTQNSDIGFWLAMAGVVLYGSSTLFMLVTLPVEYDASRRAKRMLVEEGVLDESELPYAEKMLSAAAKTYLVSLLASVVYFLRFLTWVLVAFGGRRRR